MYIIKNWKLVLVALSLNLHRQTVDLLEEELEIIRVDERSHTCVTLAL